MGEMKRPAEASRRAAINQCLSAGVRQYALRQRLFVSRNIRRQAEVHSLQFFKVNSVGLGRVTVCLSGVAANTTRRTLPDYRRRQSARTLSLREQGLTFISNRVPASSRRGRSRRCSRRSRIPVSSGGKGRNALMFPTPSGGAFD